MQPSNQTKQYRNFPFKQTSFRPAHPPGAGLAGTTCSRDVTAVHTAARMLSILPYP